jgi:hypothetical protein
MIQSFTQKGNTMKKQITREQWLEKGVAALAPVFAKAGHPLPKVKVSCSWPGGGSARKRIGECWARRMSKAGINEIFVSPLISDPVVALDILAHELVHAVDDCTNGHKPAFVRIAHAVGLTEGKPTNVRAGAELRAVLVKIVAKIGAYPHATLDLSSRKKQTARLLKCICTDEECGAVWRMTQSWIDRAGVDLQCPVCGSVAVSEGGA